MPRKVKFEVISSLGKEIRTSHEYCVKPIKVIFDKVGNMLNVWFDDPQKEHVCEETAEEIILVKHKTGKVIGFEVLNYRSARESRKITTLPVEAAILD